jgi:hypothetical protein
VEYREKKYFLKGGMLKFTFKGKFLTIKKAFQTLLYWKSKQWAHALVPPLLTRFFFKELKEENVITYKESVRILCVMACWKALWISHPPKKFKKSNYKLELQLHVQNPKIPYMELTSFRD